MKKIILIIVLVVIIALLVYVMDRGPKTALPDDTANPVSTVLPTDPNNPINTAMNPEPTSTTPPADSQQVSLQTTASGLQYGIITPGTGAVAAAGQNVSVHYVGTLPDGTKFDSSVDRGTPFEFALGAGQVIAGWDEGVAGMRVGEKRVLVIPPGLGYGAQGAGAAIPPNSTLIFQVELLGIK